MDYVQDVNNEVHDQQMWLLNYNYSLPKLTKTRKSNVFLFYFTRIGARKFKSSAYLSNNDHGR
jgi:hypothetical protein